ncbi:MAG: lipocalin-like domain-containing protein [Gemmatimonadota bacterium]
MWRLVTRHDHDADGQRRIDPMMGADPIGILAFGPSSFSAQFMKRDRAPAAATAPTPVGANNSAAVNGYDAYFGRYTVDEGQGRITLTLEGAVSPASVGVVVTRDVRVSGNALTIQLATTAFDAVPNTRTLTFGRVG